MLRKKKLVLILTVLVFALVSVVGCGGSDTNEPSDGAQSVKDKLGGRIIGIDPGAGIMAASEKALIEYELDYELVEGSDATMVATLKQAIDNNKWVVVTGWAPHWKFATWDLKFLDDPKGVYGEAETINTIVRKGLKEHLPEEY